MTRTHTQIAYNENKAPLQTKRKEIGDEGRVVTMAASLTRGKKLKRVVRVDGFEVPVTVELTETGISFMVKGSRLKVGALWDRVLKACHTPDNVPSYLHGRPVDTLLHGLQKAAKKRQKAL